MAGGWGTDRPNFTLDVFLLAAGGGDPRAIEEPLYGEQLIELTIIAREHPSVYFFLLILFCLQLLTLFLTPVPHTTVP